MTALDKYVRLEAIGIWRERPDTPPREVVVSFGSTTLVLTDLDDRPLGHWALKGITALRAEDGATVCSMTADGAETLGIRDPDMVAAIAAVARPAPPGRAVPRRRVPVAPILALALLAGAAAAAPTAIRALAARLVPVQADEIGDRMLIALIERHGPPCAAPEGERALTRIATRLDPKSPPRLRVMPLGPAPVAALPGGTVLLDRDTLAAASAPEEVAGLVALAGGRDATAALVATLGPASALAYVLTGRLGDSALAAAAEGALALPTAEEARTAAARLRTVGLDPLPFLDSVRAGARVPPPLPPSLVPIPPALDDAGWLALRQICE